MKYEYCIMRNGNNIETFSNLKTAIKFAKENNADYILKVFYDNEETENDIERVWEK